MKAIKGVKYLYSNYACISFVFILTVLLTDLKNRDMAQAVRRKPLTVQVWAHSQVSPRGICGGQDGTE